MTDLLAAVDAAFVTTSRGLRQWDDPHHGEMPAEEEYSRCLDPAKWRIIGARAEAWIEALTTGGLATIERDVSPTWPQPWAMSNIRTDVLHPAPPTALSLVIARSTIADLADAGVTIAVARADHVVGVVAPVPNCGCDACDGGSQGELDLLDEVILTVVTGAFRQLTRGRSVIRIHGNGVSAEWPPPEGIDAVLADPSGWDEVSGSPWR